MWREKESVRERERQRVRERESKRQMEMEAAEISHINNVFCQQYDCLRSQSTEV